MKKEVKTKDLYLSPELKVHTMVSERGFAASSPVTAPTPPSGYGGTGDGDDF